MNIKKSLYFFGLMSLCGAYLYAQEGKLKTDIETLYKQYKVNQGAPAGIVDTMPELTPRLEKVWKMFEGGASPEAVINQVDFHDPQREVFINEFKEYSPQLKEWQKTLSKKVLGQKEVVKAFRNKFPSWSMSRIQAMIKRLWDWMEYQGTKLTMNSSELETNISNAIEILYKPKNRPEVGQNLPPDQLKLFESLPAGIKLKFITGNSVSRGEVLSAITREQELTAIYKKAGVAGARTVAEHLVEKYGTQDLWDQPIRYELGLPSLSDFSQEEMLNAFKGEGEFSHEAGKAAEAFTDRITSNFEAFPE